MKNASIILVFLILLGFSCKKSSQFSSIPEISFISISPIYCLESLDPSQGPILSFQLKDAEGDFNFNGGSDTSYVYIKTTSVNYSGDPVKNDSLRLYKYPFPDLSDWTDRTDMNVRMDILLNNLRPSIRPIGVKIDTCYFDIWVQDLAGHKSNVIKNNEPLLFERR